jgi:hypothetical protein
MSVSATPCEPKLVLVEHADCQEKIIREEGALHLAVDADAHVPRR